MTSSCFRGAAVVAVLLTSAGASAQTARPIPRTAEGRPDLQGVWQVRNRAAVDLEDHMARNGMPAGRGVLVDGPIPYQPWAAEKKRENFANRATADPLAQCFMPGVPRIMYLDYPFQIFQTRDEVAIAFEWQLSFRLINTSGVKPPDGLEFWMGDSRGRWEGDTLVVDVRQHNDKTWFDASGNFHSDALHVVERYRLLDADTLQYEATITDPKVFTRPWTIRMPLHRHKDMPRVLEYHCRAEMEEARGDFHVEPRTWYLPGKTAPVAAPSHPAAPPPPKTPVAPSVPRAADGRPDLNGFYAADHGGANWGLEPHPERVGLTSPGRGIIIDPPDRLLPYQPWARAEKQSREQPERGYDDPTAHCFVSGGAPRSFYVPSPFHILQTPTHVVFFHERMAWRIVSLQPRPHLPDAIRLWQGDSVGRWEGDSLIVDTRNYNGRNWLNEVGDVVSHAQTIVERFTRVSEKEINYRATVTDPLVYTRPWTLEIPLLRQRGEILEVACHEDNQDLQHLKDIRDAARAKANAEQGK
jgi:hypothetical protein